MLACWRARQRHFSGRARERESAFFSRAGTRTNQTRFQGSAKCTPRASRDAMLGVRQAAKRSARAWPAPAALRALASKSGRVLGSSNVRTEGMQGGAGLKMGKGQTIEAFINQRIRTEVTPPCPASATLRTAHGPVLATACAGTMPVVHMPRVMILSWAACNARGVAAGNLMDVPLNS